MVTGSGLVAAGAELATELFFCAVFFLEFVHNSTQHSSIVFLKSHAANKTSSLNLRVYVMSVTKVIGSMNFKRGRCGLCSKTCWKKTCLKLYILCLISLVWFYGISTHVGYSQHNGFSPVCVLMCLFKW